MKTHRLFLITGMVAIGLLLTALPASACSCFQGDPRDQFEQADAAVIGEYVGNRPSEADPDWEAIYTFSVEEEWKAEFGETLDVHAANNGAACGIEAQPGQMVALFLTMDGATWRSSLCAQTSPSQMRDAASPLPEPNGSGRVRTIVGGSFGKARVMSLDGDGQTLGYGYGGDHDVSYLDACPGGKRFVEIYEARPDDQSLRRTLAVRRVDDLTVVRETELPFGQAKYVNGLDCRDRAAGKTLLFVTPTYGKPDGAVYRESANGLKRLFEDLDARFAAFGDKHVYLSGAKHRVLSMRLDGGSASVLYSLEDRQTLEPQLSGNGKYLAVGVPGSQEPRRPAKLVLIRLDGGRVRTHRLSGAGGYGSLLVWDGSKRIVSLGAQGSPVFDLELEKVGSLGQTYMSDATVAGDRLWAVSYGELYKADLPEGRLGRDRVLPSPVTYSIIAIPR